MSVFKHKLSSCIFCPLFHALYYLLKPFFLTVLPDIRINSLEVCLLLNRGTLYEIETDIRAKIILANGILS